MARSPRTEPETGEASGEERRGKGQPTPRRKEREAQRRRPLVPADRRLARKQNRERLAAEREKARLGMAAGDERYLPVRDKGPQKRFVRDYVDARWNVGEILLPLLLLVMLTYFFESIMAYAVLGVWGLIAVVVLDCFVLGRHVRKRLAEKFGADKVERGVRWYAAMRAIQMRPLRLPKPQVKRGEYPK